MRLRKLVCLFALLMFALPVAAQVNTADLSGTVMDPKGLAISGAKVTVKNLATSATRESSTDDTGLYRFVGLPPGRYELSIQVQGFARLVNPEIILGIGRSEEFNASMKIQTGTEVITVTESTELIETNRTAVSDIVDSRRISNLPINGRNYINFTLTMSQATRDSAPSIGAAPTSGLNFGGQRARGNVVNVDGADSVDNSVNGVRATVSQEAVQEFQLIVSGYMPEFGRATGGVVNIVTKSGANDVHGNVFGFIRHRSIQARNPFSVQVDPATGAVTAVKQGYTRFQGGFTLGGPIKKDRTFYFLSYETTRRQESGFTNIGANNFGLVPSTTPAVPGVTLLLTPQQQAFVNNPTVLTAPAVGGITGAQRAAQLFLIAGSSSAVALTGVDPGLAATVLFGSPTAPGAQFPLPIDCNPTGAPPVPCAAANRVPLPASFSTLRSQMGNYPVREGTSLWSARFDHQWNNHNNSFLRLNIAPSLVTGIQVNAQNQNFGQNAASRTSLQQTRDLAIVGQHVTSFSSNLFNEARFQFARRGLHYGFSDSPGGSSVAINITGFAFFGREPFSTVDRIERRWQWTDNLSWIKGHHSFKFGGDVNLIQLRSKKQQIFELNFGGIFNFGGLGATSISLPASVGGVATPGVTAAQAYGLGAPSVFIQGIGNSNKPFDNKTFAVFAQDSWKIHPRLTLNYGVRYDVELTPLFTPATALNAAAENAFGVVEGLPRDKNNVSPRIAMAWDPMGNGKTIVRAGYGLFYDHPLLAIAFNSVTAEGALSSQLISGGGSATRVSAALNPLALNAGSLFQGVFNGLPSMGFLPNQQRFDPKLANSLFVNDNFITAGFPVPILPFTLHVDGGFEYSYAQQGNLTIEHSFANDFKFSLGYTWTRGLHLNRPRNINTSDPAMLSRNFRNAAAAGLSFSSPVTVGVPSSFPANTCVPTSATTSMRIVAPGFLATAFAGSPACAAANAVGFFSTAAAFNFFRRSGPNPSFAGLVAAQGGYPFLVGLATAAGYPTGFTGVQVPWSDVMQQESSGVSDYHGLTFSVSKRFAKHFEFLSSWTWSHAMDDSTDLQTLLAPQNNNRPDLERSNSTFDQRHRWVSSAVFESPWKMSDGGWHKV
ncbi:MAG: TonB-dependent receptor, partial [Acidobacteria bacterium]|nr:TonB-dependent receptor [Acidobacteriota bacterium]